MEVANPKTKLVGGMTQKRKAVEQEATGSDGNPWLQVRRRLEEMIERARIKTPGKENEFLATVKQQVEKQMLALTGERAVPPERPKPTRFRMHSLAKQSGVPHVHWNKATVAWQVSFRRLDSKGTEMGYTTRVFAVKNFLVPGCTDEVPGVGWYKQSQKWRVVIDLKGSRKKIHGGSFTVKGDAEAKAVKLREPHGLQHKVTPVSTLAELPIFRPKVPYPGVAWRQGGQQWHAYCRVGGVQRNFFRPKDHSEEVVERTFQEATAWRKQEKERAKAKKPKVYIVGYFIAVSPESVELASKAALIGCGARAYAWRATNEKGNLMKDQVSGEVTEMSGGIFCLNLSAAFVVQVPGFRAVLEKAPAQRQSWLWRGDVVKLAHGIRAMQRFLTQCPATCVPEVQEARAYAEAVGWESADLEFIATRLSLVPMAGKKDWRKVVITQGAGPTVVAIRGSVSRYPAAEVAPERIVDTNGAGDAFVGGFLAALAKKHSLQGCCQADARAGHVPMVVTGLAATALYML
eukprot:Skav215445  [mRNA]  locus=scaffold2193:44342:48071:- [translate_table: standard]